MKERLDERKIVSKLLGIHEADEPSNDADVDKGQPDPHMKDEAWLVANLDKQTLFDEINRRAGVKIPGLEVGIGKSWNGRLYITVESDNVIDQCGLMKNVFKDVRIQNFSSELSDWDRETRKHHTIRAWLQINFQWEHIDGGTNGGSWFSAYYDYATKKWTFRDGR